MSRRNPHSRVLIVSAAVGTLAALFPRIAVGQRVGEVLPQWSPGYLDVHQIQTGKGDAAFFILPDGTTMLFDAGDGGRPEHSARGTVRRPNGERTPAEWIASYVRHMLSGVSEPALDYAITSHYHDDHMGFNRDAEELPGRDYALYGITELAEHIPIGSLIDRSWPEYDWHPDLAKPGEWDPGLAMRKAELPRMMDNYEAFVTWQVRQDGMKVERFRPGSNDQIVLLHSPDDYEFEIRNIAANGEIWTGEGTETKKHFDCLDSQLTGVPPTENMCSIVIRLRYGAFDYYTGGDIIGVLAPGQPEWYDVETPVAQVVGPVEVCVLNHHGNKDGTNDNLVRTLQPRTFIVPVWSSDHPGPWVVERMYSTYLYHGERDVFATDIMEVNKLVIGPSLERLTSDRGHIVVRVAPGGNTYQVIILDDSKESYRVTGVHGPYDAH